MERLLNGRDSLKNLTNLRWRPYESFLKNYIEQLNKEINATFTL